VEGMANNRKREGDEEAGNDEGRADQATTRTTTRGTPTAAAPPATPTRADETQTAAIASWPTTNPSTHQHRCEPLLAGWIVGANGHQGEEEDNGELTRTPTTSCSELATASLGTFFCILGSLSLFFIYLSIHL
jgi:hypothetical protein